MSHPGGKPADDLLPDARKRHLKKSLMNRASVGMKVVRSDAAAWESFLPGIDVRVLHQDADNATQTALWRLAPGARIPPHPHSKDEECLILEGVLTHQGVDYQSGDYMRAPAGSRHDTITSRDGAIMLIRGESINWSERMMLRMALALGR